MKEYINKNQKYKYIFVKKIPLGKNIKKKENYNTEYKNKSIYKFWDYIFFINEIYINPLFLA